MLRSVVSNCVSVKVLLRVSVCASICLKRPMIESTELLISLALFAVVLGWAHIVFDFFRFCFSFRFDWFVQIRSDFHQWPWAIKCNAHTHYNHECLFWSSYPRICVVCFSILCFSHIIFFRVLNFTMTQLLQNSNSSSRTAATASRWNNENVSDFSLLTIVRM